MSQILEATKSNAKDAALVAFGVPVVLCDRLSGQLNARLHLDSYVGMAREHAERALDGCRVKLQHLVGGVKTVVPARHESEPIVAESAPAEPPAKKAPAAKAPAKKAVRPGPAARR